MQLVFAPSSIVRETATATGTNCDGVKRGETPRRSRGKIMCTRQHRAGSIEKKVTGTCRVRDADCFVLFTAVFCYLTPYGPEFPISCETNDYTGIDSLRRERPTRAFHCTKYASTIVT
ncbi:hypothetical protein WN48_05655 [Eufriesea mexicana]|nr:hypothetical protein WN48_05655 [Eufriesea mexicana]